ncbi:unnamed protein product [Closterium sp. NIES-64]|nr:unnamed protein product [Closterium sp. NIES-64]
MAGGAWRKDRSSNAVMVAAAVRQQQWRMDSSGDARAVAAVRGTGAAAARRSHARQRRVACAGLCRAAWGALIGQLEARVKSSARCVRRAGALA